LKLVVQLQPRSPKLTVLGRKGCQFTVLESAWYFA
jgi:hypothetical protein